MLTSFRQPSGGKLTREYFHIHHLYNKHNVLKTNPRPDNYQAFLMNNTLLEFIDERLRDPEPEPMEQLVFILAKISLISSPVAWVVKSSTNKDDILCVSYECAMKTLKELGSSRSYILPLYTALKADVVPANSIHTLHLELKPKRKPN